MDRKQFWLYGLGLWAVYAFITPTANTQAITGQQFGSYLAEQGSSLGMQFLDVVFNGFRGGLDFLSQNSLWVAAGILIIISGFIFFKR